MDKTTETLFGLFDCRLVKSVSEIKKERRYQHHYFEYEGDEPDVCPKCNGKLYRHGTRTIQVTDVPNATPVKWSITIPRKRCKECKEIWQPTIKGIDEKRDLSTNAFFNIATRSLRDPFETIAEDYMLAGNTIKNVFIEFLQTYKQQLHFVTPAFMGIDEINIKKLGQLTVITDLEHKTLFDILHGRNQKTLTEYFDNLENRESVLWVCSDMYRPFQRSIGDSFPNARWAIDHFHVVMKANEAVDYVRRRLQDTMSKEDRVKSKRGFAFTVKRRSNNLTVDQAAKIRLLRETESLRPLAIAFDLKEDFFNIYDDNPSSKENAMKAFAEWEKSIPPDDIYVGFRTLAQTVHNFFEQIFNFWDCPIAITNAFTECSNRIIRENNLRGRGYSFEILRGRTLYRKTNLTRLIESKMVIAGPSIPKDGPVFFMECDDEEAIDDFDTLDAVFDPDFDPETGEIFEE